MGINNKEKLLEKGCWIMSEEFKIKLLETEQVQDFVTSAEKCNFDIDVSYDRIVVDAKSILGILAMDLSRVLTVRCAGRNELFENAIKKYCVA